MMPLVLIYFFIFIFCRNKVLTTFFFSFYSHQLINLSYRVGTIASVQAGRAGVGSRADVKIVSPVLS